MPRAVIFDVDGTLVDSVDLHAHAWQDAFRLFGKEVPFEDIRYQIGKGGDQLMPVFFPAQELQRFGEEMQEARGRIFRRALYEPGAGVSGRAPAIRADQARRQADRAGLVG